jgi:hypothetical protein
MKRDKTIAFEGISDQRLQETDNKFLINNLWNK